MKSTTVYRYRHYQLRITQTSRTQYVSMIVCERPMDAEDRHNDLAQGLTLQDIGEYPEDFLVTADRTGVTLRSRFGGGGMWLPANLVLGRYDLIPTLEVLAGYGIRPKPSQVPHAALVSVALAVAS